MHACIIHTATYALILLDCCLSYHNNRHIYVYVFMYMQAPNRRVFQLWQLHLSSLTATIQWLAVEGCSGPFQCEDLEGTAQGMAARLADGTVLSTLALSR